MTLSTLLLLAFLQNPKILENAIGLVKNNDVATAYTLLSENNEDLYDFGINLAQDNAYKDYGVKWFHYLIKKNDTPESRFGLAWSYWYISNPEEAMKQLTFLSFKNPSPIIQARAAYLSGLIHSSAYDRYEIAKRKLEESYAIYDQEAKNGGKYLVSVALANNALQNEQYDLIPEYLHRADIANQSMSKPYPEAPVIELNGEYAYMKQDYATSAILFEKAAKSYASHKNPYMSTVAEARQAIALKMAGNDSKAFEILEKVEETLKKNPNPQAAIILDLVWLRHKYCEGSDYYTYQNRIEEEGNKTNNQVLLRVMKELTSGPCK